VFFFEGFGNVQLAESFTVFFDFFTLFSGDFARLDGFIFFGESGKCGKRLGVEGKFAKHCGLLGKGRKEIETFS